MGGVNTRVHIAIIRQRTEWKWGMPILLIPAKNRLSQKHLLSDPQEKVGLIVPTHIIMYLSWKFGEDRSSTHIGLLSKMKVTSA